MPRKTGHSRLQYVLFATPIEDMISLDNPVRVVDAYADSFDLEALGFCAVRAQARGASSFGPDVLLIVEHPFGTIKRSWGFTYTLLKSKEKVGGETAIIFTAYNLRKAMSILGVQALIEALKTLSSGVLALRVARERPVATLRPAAAWCARLA